MQHSSHLLLVARYEHQVALFLALLKQAWINLPLWKLGLSLPKKSASSFTKSSGDDATETFETVAAKELADATPDGSVDDVAKSLQTKTMSELDIKVLFF